MLTGSDATIAGPTYLTPALRRWRHRTSTPLLVIGIGTLPLLLLELVRSDLAYRDRLFLDAVNIGVLALYLADYLIELGLAAGHRRAFVRAEWAQLLIVLAQILALAPVLTGVGAVRAVRGARALRSVAAVLRALAIGGAVASEGRQALRRHAAGFAMATAGLTWISSAVGFTLAEDVGASGRVRSFFDAIWWSSSTITTVGYGDIVPVTITGRLIGMFTMVVGISTFAVVTAKIAEFLVLASRSDAPGAEPGAEPGFTRPYDEMIVSVELTPDVRTVLTGPGAVGVWPFDRAVHSFGAENPRGVVRSDEDNERVTAELDARLRRDGVTFAPAVGAMADGRYAESGFVTMSLTRDEAIAIAVEFGQEAIFEIDADVVRTISCSEGTAKVHLRR